ncbi:MAG: hypothetical protein ACI4RA_00195, partial [Kiritimatiellia bacterium]
VFSTADLLLRRNREQQEKARAKAEDEGVAPPADDEAAHAEADEETTFSVVYEPNGRCDPYIVKIWKDGTDEEKALSLEVSRFGRIVEDEER